MFLVIRNGNEILIWIWNNPLEDSFQVMEQGTADVPLLICGAKSQSQEIFNKNINICQKAHVLADEIWVPRDGG